MGDECGDRETMSVEDAYGTEGKKLGGPFESAACTPSARSRRERWTDSVRDHRVSFHALLAFACSSCSFRSFSHAHSIVYVTEAFPEHSWVKQLLAYQAPALRGGHYMGACCHASGVYVLIV